jgi:hypothetical protein
MPAKGYLKLTDDEVRQLNIAEGSITGRYNLAKLLDKALAGSGITALAQSQVTGLVAALAAKLTATQAANVAALAAYSPVTGVDGTGSNAASKADVDSRFTDVYAKINAEIAALKAANIQASA